MNVLEELKKELSQIDVKFKNADQQSAKMQEQIEMTKKHVNDLEVEKFRIQGEYRFVEDKINKIENPVDATKEETKPADTVKEKADPVKKEETKPADTAKEDDKTNN